MIDLKDLNYVIHAHTSLVRDPSKKVRQWDQTTPYFVHPLWCATTLLHETSLPEDLRRDGSQALLYHDVLEDTTAKLPDWLSQRVVLFIQGMVFQSSEEEWKHLWNREKEIRLLKLYDKTSNLLDGDWMIPERKKQHQAHLRRLSDDVYTHFGDLHIISLAKTLLS